MENPTSSNAPADDDGVTNDLLVVNELVYKIPPDLNIATQRTQKTYRAQQNRYNFSDVDQTPVVTFHIQSGLEYVDPSNSSIECDIYLVMESTYNQNRVEQTWTSMTGMPSDFGSQNHASLSSSIIRGTYSDGGHYLKTRVPTNAVATNVKTCASTSAGQWWLDGAQSLIDTIEIIHSSGQTIQKLTGVGPLANITHQFLYTYNRDATTASAHSKKGVANITAFMYNGIQAEMDGYQLIDPVIDSLSDKAARMGTLPDISALSGTEDSGLSAGQVNTAKQHIALMERAAPFWLNRPDTSVALSGSAATTPQKIDFEEDPYLRAGRPRSLFRRMTEQAIATGDSAHPNVGNIAAYRCWAGDWTNGTTVTQSIRTHISIPLNRLPGLFQVNQMLPPQLMSGLQIQLRMARPSMGLTYFYNNGVNMQRNNAGVSSNSVTLRNHRMNFLGYKQLPNNTANDSTSGNIDTTIEQDIRLNGLLTATEPARPNFHTHDEAKYYKCVNDGFKQHVDTDLYQPYVTPIEYHSDLGIMSGQPGEIRQEDFTHRCISGTITNAAIIADSYTLAPAIQRKLDEIAASGQMRFAYPNYTHHTPAISSQTYTKGSTTQIPISVATENALWSFLGFKATNTATSYNPNRMYTRWLPYILDSYHARAGSYYYPADPVKKGNSGSWRDNLPFVRQCMLATGQLNKSNPGQLTMQQLMPEYYKLWCDDGGIVNKYMPTVYHLPNSTMCGYWTSLERSSVLSNSGMPLNQNRQLTYIVEGGLPPSHDIFGRDRGDSTFKVYKGLDSFINPSFDTLEVHGPAGLIAVPMFGGRSDNTNTETYPTEVPGYPVRHDHTVIPPQFAKIPGSDLIASFDPSLYYTNGVECVCIVASVAYITVLLNTIVKRE